MKKNRKKTAQEPKVQEQLVANISIDNAKLIKINTLITKLNKELKSLPESIKVTYQNS